MSAISLRDPAALETFYDRHAPAVLALCLRVLGNQAEAEEVLEDIFWEIWNRADRYDPERSSPRVYTITVTRSRAIDRLRQIRRRTGALGEFAQASLGLAPGGSPANEAVPFANALAGTAVIPRF